MDVRCSHDHILWCEAPDRFPRHLARSDAFGSWEIKDICADFFPVEESPKTVSVDGVWAVIGLMGKPVTVFPTPEEAQAYIDAAQNIHYRLLFRRFGSLWRD